MNPKRIAQTSKLLEHLHGNPSKVLSGQQSGIQSNPVYARPVYRVENVETGERLAVKMSRLNSRLLDIQMSCISSMRCENEFIPLNYGFCQDRYGRSFEIWEWLDKGVSSYTLEDSSHNTILEDFLVRFAGSSDRMGWAKNVVFPNDTLNLFQNVLGSDIRRLIELDQSVSESCREILLKASAAWKCAWFRKAAQGLPRAFIHTDIRQENILSGFLIDYSNSKYDMRILEVARFININFGFASLTHKYASQPWLAFGICESELSVIEIELFKRIVLIDFACIYVWARQQIQEAGSKSAWANAFMSEASNNLIECFGSI